MLPNTAMSANYMCVVGLLMFRETQGLERMNSDHCHGGAPLVIATIRIRSVKPSHVQLAWDSLFG